VNPFDDPGGSEPGIDAVQVEYDRLAAFYDRRWRQYIDATLTIVEAVVKCDGHERILDVPCGTGELEQRLLTRWPGLSIVGVDLSHEMLKQAQSKSMPDFVEWIRADVCALPLADQTFDWVICANSFHYFHSPGTALRELTRVLRPNGQLVLVDWCDDYLTCKICSLWLRWEDPAFYRTSSLHQCRSQLEQAGLIVEDGQHFRVGWIWGMMRFVCRRPHQG
jgi:ubiquinone/menaquinone biosynthesis C-methylase UbiE